MDTAGEQITLPPLGGAGPLMKEHGVWAFRTGQALAAAATDEALRQIREERDVANLGQEDVGRTAWLKYSPL